ncbi:MAG: DUF4197 domain-containing protein [Bacteroidota bacterium]|nr:DUF4197 domain-containing protein [Bacteroidota bacterium]
MKKITFLAAVMVGIACSVSVNAQLLKNAQKLVKTVQSKGLSETDAANGIKEALIKGTNESVKVASVTDGFMGNPKIRIPFPEDAKNVETKLRAMGFGNKVDQTILSINRAAEDAAKDAAPIFVTAVKNMSVKDAVNIVKGQNDAATQYLKTNTSAELNTKFQPNIKASLDKVSATRYWSDLINLYNKIPLVKKVNPNLTEYVTGKAIDGLFVMIAQEEGKIRQDPAARTSDLLKKVFGK